MSLLMDALKKAELAKRQGAAGDDHPLIEPSDLSELSLEPVHPTAKSALASLPSLETALHADMGAVTPAPRTEEPFEHGHAQRLTMTAAPLTAVDRHGAIPSLDVANQRERGAPLSPRASPPPSTQDTQRIADDRKDADNLFRAKHPTNADGNKKTFAIALGVMTLLAGSAIGAYFWWQLQPKSSMHINPASAPLPRPAPPPATPISPPPPVATAPTAEAVTTKTDTLSAQAASTITTTKPSLSRQAVTLPTDDNDDDRPIRLTKSPLRVNPDLARGFDAASRGDRASAQAAYTAVLASDPQNTDALHGMADLALHAGKLPDAERYLQQILVANPRDATALAGLTNLYARSNPAQAEGRLKALADAQPEQAAPFIALGNLYVAQGRWHEAQQAYFTAYASQPDNPDVLFNLAISLEHLNQPRLAQQYYREALQASKRRPASFTATQIEERLGALQP